MSVCDECFGTGCDLCYDEAGGDEYSTAAKVHILNKQRDQDDN